MIIQISVGGYDKNFSYFVGDGSPGGEVGVVDPSNIPMVEAELKRRELDLKMILLTHSHFDHADWAAELVWKYGVPVCMHVNAKGRVDVGEENLFEVVDGSVIEIGGLKVRVIYTPGHIDDAVCYFVEVNEASSFAGEDVGERVPAEEPAGGRAVPDGADGAGVPAEKPAGGRAVPDGADGAGVPAVLTGDTLFVGGCGRADLEGGNVENLYESLCKLKELPDETVVYPGHDYGDEPVSTIGEEKMNNKYLRCGDVREFREVRGG